MHLCFCFDAYKKKHLKYVTDYQYMQVGQYS